MVSLRSRRALGDISNSSVGDGKLQPPPNTATATASESRNDVSSSKRPRKKRRSSTHSATSLAPPEQDKTILEEGDTIIETLTGNVDSDTDGEDQDRKHGDLDQHRQAFTDPRLGVVKAKAPLHEKEAEQQQQQQQAPPHEGQALAADSNVLKKPKVAVAEKGNDRVTTLPATPPSRTKSPIDGKRWKRCNLPSPKLEPHDREDSNNPMCCTEYISDMYERYRSMEERFCPLVYMHMQEDINAKMRAILIDWIVEVHLKFKLAPPTLYLTVHIIDRYCMLENVHRGMLQLVGVTALLIACKYEEVIAPEVRDCVYITDHAYSREDVLDMEKKILSRMGFQVTVPTAWNFLSRLMKVARVTDLQYQRACYFSERVLQEHDILAFRPSVIAATAVYLALIYDANGYAKRVWTSRLVEFSNITEHQMHPCAHMMLNFLHAEPVTASRRHLVAVKKKFTLDRYLCVASESLPMRPPRGEI